MSGFKKGLMYLIMLNKRLYKKPAFIAVLVLIVCVAWALNAFSTSGSPVVKVALYYVDDEETEKLIAGLNDDAGLIYYKVFETRDEAVDAVATEGFDAAWLFDRDIKSAAREYVKSDEALMQAIQKEENVFMRLAREKAHAAMYPYISREIYNEYMYESYDLKDEEVLDEYYKKNRVRDDILEILYINSDERTDELNYVIGPVRGILAIAVFLCAYGALMGFKKDRNSGLWGRMAINKHVYATMATVVSGTINAGIVSVVAIGMTGLFTKTFVEIGYMLLYVVLCTLFCTLLGEFMDRPETIGALMPIVSIMMLILCPVFINITNHLQMVQLVLPPYYYLMAFRDERFILLGIVYAVVLIAALVVTRKIKTKKVGRK